MKNKSNKKSLPSVVDLYDDFKIIRASLTKENWLEKLELYFQKIKDFSGGVLENRMVFGWVAGLCERAYYVAAHNKKINIQETFECELQKTIISAPLPKFLADSGPVVCGKSQPSFLGSVGPTLDRYRVMEQLSEIFRGNVESIIIGGSMSYSPFFGIRENKKDKDFSDIDALIVINDNFFKKGAWDNFLKDNIFSLVEKQKFISRIKIFQALLRKCEADVFSQRFSVCGKSFSVSIHFLTWSAFERMICSDLKKSLKTRKDLCYSMRDFRVEQFFHPCHARHTFDGQRVETVIGGHSLSSGGFIAVMPGYIISNGNFYPGVYQTVISTAFLVFYDFSGKTKGLVRNFEKIIYQETTRAQEISPLASYARAHNRYEIFPLGRFEEGCNSYVSPDKIKKYRGSCYSNIPVAGIVIGEDRPMVNKKFHYEHNDKARDKVRQSLAQWKQRQLKKADMSIAHFINGSDFKTKMLFVKNQGSHWYTVVTIPSNKKEVVKLPYPYIENKVKKTIIREEVSIQVITPWEIMSLKWYGKLALKVRKVYIASIIDPANTKNKTPLSYAIVISVL